MRSSTILDGSYFLSVRQTADPTQIRLRSDSKSALDKHRQDSTSSFALPMDSIELLLDSILAVLFRENPTTKRFSCHPKNQKQSGYSQESVGFFLSKPNPMSLARLPLLSVTGWSPSVDANPNRPDINKKRSYRNNFLIFSSSNDYEPLTGNYLFCHSNRLLFVVWHID